MSNLPPILGNYHLHFMSEETDTQRGYYLCQATKPVIAELACESIPNVCKGTACKYYTNFSW